MQAYSQILYPQWCITLWQTHWGTSWMHLNAKCWNTSYLTRVAGCKGKDAAVARSFAFVWLPWSSCIYSTHLCAEWLVWKMSDIQVIKRRYFGWNCISACKMMCIYVYISILCMHISNLNSVRMFDFGNLCSANPLLSPLHIIHWKGLNGISSTQLSTPSSTHDCFKAIRCNENDDWELFEFPFVQLNMGVVCSTRSLFLSNMSSFDGFLESGQVIL